MLPYDELTSKCRSCSQGCEKPWECGYFNKPPLRCMRQLLSDAADAIDHLQKAVLRLEEESGILDELPLVDQTDRCATCRYHGDTEFDACHICNNEQDMYRPKKTRADAYFYEATNEELARNLTALVAVLPFEGLNSCDNWLAWLRTELRGGE